MAKQPLISVIIPIYNVEAYVTEAINSILQQTYRNLEIIVIDDCSTDSSKYKVEQLQKQDQRIKLYSNPKNSKIVYSLNFAISIAQGEFIARMDGDDLCLPDRIERQYNFLIQHPDIDLVGTHVYGIDHKGKVLNQTRYPITNKLINKSLLNISPVAHIWLARKEVYTALNGYREIPGAEDYDFLLRMHSLSLKFTNLDYFGYSVRMRSNNTNGSLGLQQKKAALYCIKLYKERQKFGYDSFSLTNIHQFTQAGALTTYLYKKSNFLINKAILYKGYKHYFLSAILLLLAISISPYQFNYVYKKIKYRLIMAIY